MTEMKNIKCIFLEETNLSRVWLRRYVGNSVCTCKMTYHNAMNMVADMDRTQDFGDYTDDPRWPSVCSCGYKFVDQDTKQVFARALFSHEGKLFTIEDAPVGSMWYSSWHSDTPEWCGTDGKSLTIKTPGGIWHIDSRASNCTMKDDKIHKCWVRHGTPPDITVDKNGLTCAAGAGSIRCGDYHGFLRNGFLVD